MNLLELPWLDLAILAALAGSISVSRLRDPARASRWGIWFTGASFSCTFLAWLAFYLGADASAGSAWGMQQRLFGRQLFALDELNAPLVPAVALLHFLTGLATARTKMRRFSYSWSLAAEVIRLATFSCKDPWVLIGLLAISTVPPYVELLNRGRTVRVYVLHMALFVGLLVFGWMLVESGGGAASAPRWTTLPLAAAVLIRCGTVPAHCWVTDWFEHASLGIALLFVVPLSGVYAAVRLVLPVAPDWVLQVVGLMSLFTAVYAAAMSTIQREARRFYAHLFLSHASLVLVGLELHTELSLTASLCLWFSVILSLGGFGLTLRALEARYGRLSLSDYHGLYEHSPMLAVCFLLTGLACVGFPATLGFISTELLVDTRRGSQSLCRHRGRGGRGAQRHRGRPGLLHAVHRGPAHVDGLARDRPARAVCRADAGGADSGRRSVPFAGRADEAPRRRRGPARAAGEPGLGLSPAARAGAPRRRWKHGTGRIGGAGFAAAITSLR